LIKRVCVGGAFTKTDSSQVCHIMPDFGEWLETAIRLEREAAGLVPDKGGKPEPEHCKIVFSREFEEL